MKPIDVARSNITSAIKSVASAQYALISTKNQTTNGSVDEAIRYAQTLAKVELELGGVLFCLGLEVAKEM